MPVGNALELCGLEQHFRKERKRKEGRTTYCSHAA
jgi:hypothetical protein